MKLSRTGLLNFLRQTIEPLLAKLKNKIRLLNVNVNKKCKNYTYSNNHSFYVHLGNKFQIKIITD